MKNFKRLAAIMSMLWILTASTFAYAIETGDSLLMAGFPDREETTACQSADAEASAIISRCVDGLPTTAIPPESQEPPSIESTLDALRDRARSMFTAALLPFSDELSGVRLSTYDQIAAKRECFVRMTDALNSCLADYYSEAILTVCRDLRSIGIPLLSAERGRTELRWQEAAALYRAYGAAAGECIAAGLCIELVESAAGADFTCAFSEGDAMFLQGSREQLVAGKFALAYLLTVYSDDGERADYATPVLDAAYLETLAHPLPGCMVKNGWYDPRSSRTRLHTGTDIRANRNTPILSMTDGTVLYIGFSRTPGFYVIVRDPLGYEYHYYHMVKMSDLVSEGETVTQGQVIGLVGSTGNSTANHLHLAIVTPEGAYINPYDVFVQAGIGPIRPSA